MVNTGVEAGDLLHETIEVRAALQQLGDEMLVDDVAVELLRGNLFAVTKLEVLDQQGRAVELVAAANAW